ncbi:MAG: hypothetical protein AB7G88_03490, partial [Thermomicrobiales bacterium]
MRRVALPCFGFVLVLSYLTSGSAAVAQDTSESSPVAVESDSTPLFEGEGIDSSILAQSASFSPQGNANHLILERIFVPAQVYFSSHRAGSPEILF